MASKKKDLEIIYNLQWKTKPANGGDKSNIIGMYDIPATTLNWEIFKSYLLKNSGTVGEDVKVSYITDGNREFPIESQTDFQIALYAFRRKARLGDIVNLKLDRISDQPTHKNLRHSNDVETQFDNNEAVSLSSCCNTEAPPEWFVTYMSQFKKNLTEELTATISSIVSNIKPQVVSQPSCLHLRKSKNDCPKRIRKAPTFIGESSHEPRPKELLKSLKLESKLERKLEKLEHKTKKIKEKKLPLLTKSSDSDAGQSSRRNHTYRRCETENDVLEMDAAPISSQSTVPHMLGGEVYLHQWEVMNTGKAPWTSKTTLNFTWGSKALKPLDTVISVPYLKPGETGTLAVRLQIPDRPGQYECYWHFHHKERRFGHWLGCQIIVDPFDLKGNKSVLETSSFVSEFITNPKKIKTEDVEYGTDKSQARYEILQEPPTEDVRKYVFNIEPDVEMTINKLTSEPVNAERGESSKANILDSMLDTFDINTRMDDMKLQDPTDTNCSSDSDNQSIISLSESNSSKSIPEEFVVVPIPDCFKIDQVSSSKIFPEQQATHNDKDLVTDSIGNNPLDPKSVTEQVSNNCDDNNNSEKSSQKSSGIGSPTKWDDSLSNDESQKSDIVVISIPNQEEEDKAGCAYLIVDGHRLPIPRKILNSEYLKMSEGAAGPSKENLIKTSPTSSIPSVKQNDTDAVVNTQELVSISAADSQDEFRNQKIELDVNSDVMSHCSAAGSCFSEVGSASDKNSRLFIFPQTCPGFEVVYPSASVPVQSNPQEYNWSESVPSQPPTTAASAPPLNLSTHDRNPFATGVDFHIPNFQQTPPDMRTPPPAAAFTSTTDAANVPIIHATTATAASVTTPTSENVRLPEAAPPMHILPETLVSGAVNVASSAINTARSVINMIVPREQPGRWVNGHWVSSNAETPREANLQALAEMGFWNRDLNATLLARYNDDLSRVVAELVQ